MKKLLIVAVSALAAACAPAATGAPAAAPPAPAAQTQAANAGMGIYPGTYSLRAPNRVIELRVWMDLEGRLNGELVGASQQTVFRPSDTPHRFLHATRDDIWVQFTVENGRATSATMHQGTREISGPRKA